MDLSLSLPLSLTQKNLTEERDLIGSSKLPLWCVFLFFLGGGGGGGAAFASLFAFFPLFFFSFFFFSLPMIAQQQFANSSINFSVLPLDDEMNRHRVQWARNNTTDAN